MWGKFSNPIASGTGRLWNKTFGSANETPQPTASGTTRTTPAPGQRFTPSATAPSPAAGTPLRNTTPTTPTATVNPPRRGQRRPHPEPGHGVPDARRRAEEEAEPIHRFSIPSFAEEEANFQQLAVDLRQEIPTIHIADRFHPDQTRQMFLEDLQTVIELREQDQGTYNLQYLQNFRRCMYYAVRSVPPGETKPFTVGRTGIHNPGISCYYIATLQVAVHEYVYDYFLIRPLRPPLPQEEMIADYEQQIRQLNQQIGAANQAIEDLAPQIRQQEAERAEIRRLENERDSHDIYSTRWHDLNDQVQPLVQIRLVTDSIDAQVEERTNARDQLTARLNELTQRRDTVNRYRERCRNRDRYLREYFPALRDRSGAPLHLTLEELQLGDFVPEQFQLRDDDIRLGEGDWYNQFQHRLDNVHWRAIRRGAGWHITALVRNQDNSVDLLNDAAVTRRYTDIEGLRTDYKNRRLWDHHSLFWMQ
ncbi:hypothetical protein M3P05_06165 [Sansalvadorimonas sp. 2012CJ34-2]|uniref:Uncharacterized protein n=1 Tax=Parendozoicomonas callyspongiae TaxID=2942213 RepID=A0ABT0PDQ7_9GAMM|nr:hypothetical protein [Sansalvadorimonas sp. 2012CJ34-2]MCL6269524.1 hypothetical protein [Sansalvadorimonas sp. 2012CJ34-2]